MTSESNTFIVSFWSKIFNFLGKISVFTLVGRVLKKPLTPGFVDSWVLAHLVVSIGAVFTVVAWNQHWISYLLAGYGFLRTCEVVIYQANVMLFDEFRAQKDPVAYSIEGYRRMVLLLIHNYFEIIFWLACTYTVFAADYQFKFSSGAPTVLGGIYSSFITMTTFGDFNLSPQTKTAAVILMFHSTVGLFMTLLSLARFIALLPTPKAKNPMG